MSPIFKPQTKERRPKEGLSDFDELFKRSLSLYRQNFKILFWLVSAAFIFLVVFNLAHYLMAGREPSWSLSFVIGASFWLAAFAAMALSYLFYQIAARLVLSGARARLAELSRSARPLFLPVSGLLAMMLAMVVVWTWLALLASEAGSLSRVLVPIAALLAFPLGLGLVWGLFASYALVQERNSLGAALRLSRQLLSGRAGSLLAKFGLLALLNLAVLLLFSYLSGRLPEASTVKAAVGLIFSLLSSLIGPIYIIFGHLLYGELKNFK